MMRQFAESRTCRSQSLLTYFGDRLDAACGHCDNCRDAQPPVPVLSPKARRKAKARASSQSPPGRPDRSRAAPPHGPGGPTAAPRPGGATVPTQPTGVPAPSAGSPAGQPFPVHSTVRHRTWGTGVVLGYEQDRMTVLFDSVGYKTLSVGVVRSRDLLVAEV